jgi:hypothetical protein
MRNLGVIVTLCASPVAIAADHADGSMAGLNNDPAADITDVFAWMSSDGSKVNLVMDVFPVATTTSRFSNAIQYAFHLTSKASLLASTGTATNVICTFDAATPQAVSCWVVQGSNTLDYVTGDASGTNGVTSASGKVRVFAGPRNDPFFFNLAGFKKATQAVALNFGRNPGFANNMHGQCPPISATVAGPVAGLLSKDCNGAPNPVDFFSASGSAGTCTGEIKNRFANPTGNILALVVQLDKTLVVGGNNNIMAVWASTRK